MISAAASRAAQATGDSGTRSHYFPYGFRTDDAG